MASTTFASVAAVHVRLNHQLGLYLSQEGSSFSSESSLRQPIMAYSAKLQAGRTCLWLVTRSSRVSVTEASIQAFVVFVD